MNKNYISINEFKPSTNPYTGFIKTKDFFKLYNSYNEIFLNSVYHIYDRNKNEYILSGNLIFMSNKLKAKKIDKFDILISKIDQTNNKINNLENDISTMKQEWIVFKNNIETRIVNMEISINKINNRLDRIENRLDIIENRLDRIENCPTIQKELNKIY